MLPFLGQLGLIMGQMLPFTESILTWCTMYGHSADVMRVCGLGVQRSFLLKQIEKLQRSTPNPSTLDLRPGPHNLDPKPYNWTEDPALQSQLARPRT